MTPIFLARVVFFIHRVCNSGKGDLGENGSKFCFFWGGAVKVSVYS